ncbi:MAG: glycosyltransferase family 2 protein [Bacteroidales bacterium]|nr:glycosyltransferase family 2 protein [Bacteroidales bacterium]
MTNAPTYSIIIPHFNIPNLLMRCLDSIPVRDDVQVIVVDDNSPDADSYLDRYPSLSRPYLEFIRTTQSGGAGYARNVGLEHAKGQWLVFADADDLFVNDFSSILDNFHSDEPTDIVFFRHINTLSDDISRYSTEHDYLDNLILLYLQTSDDTNIRCMHQVPWGKFIRRSLITRCSLRFDETPYANDICFSTASGCHANSIQVQNTFLYIHTQRDNSLSDNFAMKPGELEIRSEACFRAQRIIFESGRSYIGRNPISYFLSLLYHRNRPFYNLLFRRLPQAGLSPWMILRQTGGWEERYSSKIKVYLHSIPLFFKLLR